MTQTLTLKQAGPIVLDLVETINANRAYLSEIDGLIGDGDHGINMSKGFTQCGEALRAHPTLPGLAEGLDTLAMTLLEGIGGSMGPLYGSFFMGLAETLSGKETLDAQLFGEALANGVAGVETVGSAKIGDKTLMDTLVPAREAFQAAVAGGADFSTALTAMIDAAETQAETLSPFHTAKPGTPSPSTANPSVSTVRAAATLSVPSATTVCVTTSKPCACSSVTRPAPLESWRVPAITPSLTVSTFACSAAWVSVMRRDGSESRPSHRCPPRAAAPATRRRTAATAPRGGR